MTTPAPAAPSDPPPARRPDSGDDTTGLPGFPTWGRVYAVVLGGLGLVILLLALFSRAFA